jgi:hypothetical protein
MEFLEMGALELEIEGDGFDNGKGRWSCENAAGSGKVVQERRF